MTVNQMLLRHRLLAESSPYVGIRWYAFPMILSQCARGVAVPERVYACPLSAMGGYYAQGMVTFCTGDVCVSDADGLYSVTPNGESPNGDALYLWNTDGREKAVVQCLVCGSPKVVCGWDGEYPDFGFRGGYLYVRIQSNRRKL